MFLFQLNELKTYYNPLMKLTEEDDLSTMSEKVRWFFLIVSVRVCSYGVGMAWPDGVSGSLFLMSSSILSNLIRQKQFQCNVLGLSLFII